MSLNETGGTAFPNSTAITDDGNVIPYPTPGLSLRQYYAIKALAAVIIARGDSGSLQDDVEAAFRYADLMIREGGIA